MELKQFMGISITNISSKRFCGMGNATNKCFPLLHQALTLLLAGH
jgi:hypothetical protein